MSTTEEIIDDENTIDQESERIENVAAVTLLNLPKVELHSNQDLTRHDQPISGKKNKLFGKTSFYVVAGLSLIVGFFFLMVGV